MDKKQCAMTRYLAEKNTLGPEISRDTILSLLDYIEELEKDAVRYRWSLENWDEAVEIFVNNCDPEVINRFVDSAMGEMR